MRSEVNTMLRRHPHVLKHRVLYYVAVVATVSLVLQIVFAWTR